MYDRDHPRYPYRSHGQWFKAMYGMIICAVILVFSGVGTFLENPFDIRRFMVYYTPVSFLLILLQFDWQTLCNTNSHTRRYWHLLYYSWATRFASTDSISRGGDQSVVMLCTTRSRLQARWEKGGWSSLTWDSQKTMFALFSIGYGYGWNRLPTTSSASYWELKLMAPC
jgi:hypothetical protein